jgi:hypothetical protein
MADGDAFARRFLQRLLVRVGRLGVERLDAAREIDELRGLLDRAGHLERGRQRIERILAPDEIREGG